MNHSLRRHCLAHPEVYFLYLAVVFVQSRRLKRVLCAFEKAVVEIAPAVIGRIDLRRNRQPARELREQTADPEHHHAAILSTLAADEHARADMTIVAVKAWREGKVELGLPHLAHGAAPAGLACCCAPAVCAADCFAL